MRKRKPVIGTIDNRDNLAMMRELKDECVDLIVADPPYDPSVKYGNEDALSLQDINENVSAVVDMSEISHSTKMRNFLGFHAIRFIEMHRILKDTGSLYIQFDGDGVHYIKQLLDTVFGAANFRKDIIWATGDSSGFKGLAKNWIRGNDNILYYVKNAKQRNFTFNKQYNPHQEDSLKGYSKTDEDGRKYKQYKNPERRVYLDESPGVPMSSVWDDINSFQTNANSPEYLGVPFQKPLELAERIIKASSNEGDVVFDPFCGTGTVLLAANNLNRQWFGCDDDQNMIVEAKKRLGIDMSYKDIEREAEEEFLRQTKGVVSDEEKKNIGRSIMRPHILRRDKYICRPSGLRDTSVLEACHIMPWALFPDYRFDMDNYLTLSRTWHGAFDAFKVTFEDDGSPRFSKRCDKDTVERLTSQYQEPLELSLLQIVYLKWHREEFEKREKGDAGKKGRK